MKEILCVTHKYPPTIGGMEKQSYELIKGLGKFYKTHVIAYQSNGHKMIWFLMLCSQIQSILKANPKIGLIHLNDGTMGTACLWLQHSFKIPVVVTYHGLDITFPLRIYQRRIVPRLRNYAGAICVSDFTRKECIKRGFSEATTFTVRNGVDITMGDIPTDPGIVERLKSHYDIDVTDKHILLTTGRPVKRKGFSWFLKNVMPLLDENILFLMIGPMKEKASFLEKNIASLPGGHNWQLLLGIASESKDIAELLKTTKNAHHLGIVPYNDLLQLLSLADLFVMPNIKVEGDEEGFGLVALEASIRGTYVLASGIEGITDAVIDGQNGSLLPSEDAQAWAQKIKQLLSDKTKLNELSYKGKNFTCANYSWDNMVKGYKEVFDKIMGG